MRKRIRAGRKVQGSSTIQRLNRPDEHVHEAILSASQSKRIAGAHDLDLFLSPDRSGVDRDCAPARSVAVSTLDRPTELDERLLPQPHEEFFLSAHWSRLAAVCMCTRGSPTSRTSH